MRIFRTILLCGLILFGMSPSVFATGADSILSRIAGQVDTYLDIKKRALTAKEDSWLTLPFTETQSSVNKELNHLLDKSLAALLDDDVLETKRMIATLSETNTLLQQEIADLEVKKIAAPSEKKSYELWKEDIKDLDSKITDRQRALVANKAKIEAAKQTIQHRLRSAGIEMSSAEIESLLNTVTGTDTLQSMVVLKNVQGVLEKLKGLMARENENIHIAKKYYGLFLLSTSAYMRQLQLFSDRINEHYVPKLRELRAENAALMEETKKLAKTDKSYQSNLKAQIITDAAAEKYEKVLASQWERLQERTAKVTKIYTLAYNTYRTVTLAHSLFETMNEGMQSYESMMNLPLLDPVPFENRELEQKYLEITRRLQE